MGAIALAIVSSGCSDDEAICSAGELEAALGRAGPGDTVRVGACRITGAFTVPAGVTIAGQGPEASVIVAEEGGLAIELIPGTEATRAVDLSVESNGRIAVLARGSGRISLERVDVQAMKGVALGAEGLEGLTLTDVTLDGPVTPENADELPFEWTAEDTATHGLFIVSVEAAELNDVTSRGFAGFGAAIGDSGVTWRGGGVSDNLGTGLLVQGGTATLDGVALRHTFQKSMSLGVAYGGVFVAGAVVETSGLEVSDGEQFGILHESATVRHIDLVARDNGDAALWAQHCPSLEISGAATELRGNRLAGVVLIDPEEVTLRDAEIAVTTLAPYTVGESGLFDAGDGVHLVRPAGSVLMEGLSLEGNERVGVLVDLGDEEMEGVTFDGVTVNGSDDQLGVIVQNGTFPEGWDTGVTREGDASGNDERFIEAGGALPVFEEFTVDKIPNTPGELAGIIGDCC
jgi:hypothetical protein